MEELLIVAILVLSCCVWQMCHINTAAVTEDYGESFSYNTAPYKDRAMSTTARIRLPAQMACLYRL